MDTDNGKWTSSHMSLLFTQDEIEGPHMYNPLNGTQFSPPVVKFVEPVDDFINSMLSFNRNQPYSREEWLLSDDELFEEQGFYNGLLGVYIDCDSMTEKVNQYLDDMMGE
ncbi:hypothetical protein [Vibrio phage RYC]|nr:hypothetical protein [Vibrio phage RYC]